MATSYKYETKYGLIRITECISNDKEIRVPSKIDGKNVYQICKGSFINLSVERLYIPTTVGKIEDSAFIGLNNLTYFECHNIDDFNLPFDMDCSNISVFSNSSKVADKFQKEKDDGLCLFKKVSYKNDIKWEIIDPVLKTAKITKFTLRGSSIVFPDFIDGYKVVKLDVIIDKPVLSVVFPKYLEEIPDNFLVEQERIITVTFPNTLKKIGKRAFYKTILKSFVMPKTVVLIDDEAFWDGHFLEKEPIYFKKGSVQKIELGTAVFSNKYLICHKNIHFVFNGIGTFYKCWIRNIYFYTDNDVIPSGNFIGSKLISLKGFENIRKIENRAFCDCNFYNRTFLNLRNVTEVGEDCFTSTFIDKVFIPKNLPLSPYMFSYSKVKSVTFERGYLFDTIPEGCFSNTTFLEHIRLPKSIRVIRRYGFYACRAFILNLKNVESIEDFAFSKSFISFANLHSLKELGFSAFESCIYLHYINFSRSTITKIPDKCFYKCDSLCEVSLSKTIKEIGVEAFFEDRQLKDINLRNIEKVEEKSFYNTGIQGEFKLLKMHILGKECFYGCINMTKVIFSKKVKVLPYNTFRFCTKLEYLRADGVEVFGMKSLSCTNIKEFVFPKSTVVIEPYTFLYSKIRKCTINQKNGFFNKNIFNLCDYLEEVTINGCKVLSSNSLSELRRLKTVVLGDDLIVFKTGAIHSNPSLTSVVIKNNKCAIQGKNFVKCKQLKTIYFNNVIEANKLIKRKGTDIKIRKDVADFK